MIFQFFGNPYHYKLIKIFIELLLRFCEVYGDGFDRYL